MKVFIWMFFVFGVFGVDTFKVSVMEGDSVTLQTDVKVTQKHRIKWYFNDTRIAEIIGGQSKIYTDVQFTERFRDRLKLDHQTGSLTIMNTRKADAGLYNLQIIFNSSSIVKSFSVDVTGVPAAQRDELKTMSVKEGEPVTLDPGTTKNLNDVMTWYFNNISIAEITGDQSKICTDVQCEEKFRDRLKLDHQTGSLTIMDTKTTDSGEYKLEISSSISIQHRRRRSVSITSVKSFRVSVIAVSGSGAVAGISVAVVVLLVFAVVTAGVIYRRHRIHIAVPQNEDEGL
ncbi:junctional adhesion molecule-like [Chanodichthys erythropterus]|uniref:junctional adhesion molecule-like n=1 Tax=Chanodichthys erythropterus TaxID=933992 RepID=UPI00351EABC0